LFLACAATEQISDFKVKAGRIPRFCSSAGDKTPKREIDRAESCKKGFEGRVKYES
jgi:hypothetical protein